MGAPRPTPVASVGPVWSLLVRTQLTRGRALGLVALGALAVVVGAASRGQLVTDAANVQVNLVLAVVAPLTALIFATASLGDLRDDGTLVYLWLRPVRRSGLAVAAWAATLTASLPVVVASAAATAAASSPLAVEVGAGDPGLRFALGSAVASAVAVAAYAGVFTWLGLVARRALVLGLVYVLIWEGFVASAGTGPARLSIRYHATAVLLWVGDVPFVTAGADLTTFPEPTAGTTVVPLAAALAALGVAAAGGVALTARRLARQEIE